MQWIRIAQVVRAIGLRGHVGVVGWDAEYARVNEVAVRSSDDSPPTLRRVLEGREQGKVWALKLEGIEDRTAAEGLVGYEVLARREDLGEPGEGQHWWSDLEGLPVWSKSGERLGSVQGLYATGGVDVLIVTGEKGEVLIPLAPYVEIDLKEGRITVDPPDGLLEIGS